MRAGSSWTESLHNSGYLHGDVSPYNIAVAVAEDGTTITTIIDLATVRPLGDPKVCWRISTQGRKNVAMGHMLSPWACDVCEHLSKLVVTSVLCLV